MNRSNFTLALLGAASVSTYLATFGLGDLRRNTFGFEVVFFCAFAWYLAAVGMILRARPLESRITLPLIFIFALAFNLILLPTRPTLSDDMYRYVWDGRVQARGISPYRYPPQAAELKPLRQGDNIVWKHINRKEAVTIYPPGAQLAYAGIWRIAGDSVTGFKLAFIVAELIGGLLLLKLLAAFKQPPERVLIYLWSPLLVFEVAHAGHVDALMLPLLILALWARATNRHGLLGLSLGAATLVKLFPALLLPALLPLPMSPSRESIRPALRTLVAFFGVIAAGYAVYAFGDASALGFLPQYFNENFNMGFARIVFDAAKLIGLPGPTLANAIAFGGLAVMSIMFLLRPTGSAPATLTRCVWLIGWFTLTTQNLFAWYLLWLLPLIALFVEPGKFFGLKFAPMPAWLIFSGLIALSYTFFIRWRPVAEAQLAEYLPLYAMLLLSASPHARSRMIQFLLIVQRARSRIVSSRTEAS
jgi:hypothetical protein